MKPEERTNKERRLSSKTEGLCDISITIQKAKFKPFKALRRVGGGGLEVAHAPPLDHALQTDRPSPQKTSSTSPEKWSGFHLQSSRGIQTSQSFGGGDHTDGSYSGR